MQRHPDNWRNWIPAVVCGWDLFWFVMGWCWAHRFRDSDLIIISRAVIKLLIGSLAPLLWRSWDEVLMFTLAFLVYWSLTSPLLPPALYLVDVWCCVTGVIKFLMLRRSDGSANG